MAILDEYILRAARLLRSDSSENADDLCREIIDVFKLDYTNPESFRFINSSSSFRYSSSDLRTIVQMLRLERENQDEERYGSKCCHAITEHIRRLEQALEEGLQGEPLKAVYDSVDYVYANAKGYDSYQVTVETTFEQIDKLPETTLSDDDKTLLKGMIGDLNTKDQSKRDSKLSKLQSWLAGKGTDVFIAAMPYIVQLIKSQLF